MAAGATVAIGTESEAQSLEVTDHKATTIGWREAGTGEPLVFLHGLGGSRTAWEPQLDDLGDSFRCIAWDMPGYGASDFVDTLSYRLIADAVVQLLDDLGLARATLVGESFGGMHALHTAIHYPNRVSRLVLTNTSPAFGMDGTVAQEWQAARLGPLDAGQQPSDFAEAVLASIAGPLLNEDAMKMRVAAFGRISAKALRASVECLPANDVRGDLASIRAPTLVLAGELDEETPVSYGKTLADGLPNARLVVLAGVGHLAASEDPRRFNELVRDFIAKHPLP